MDCRPASGKEPKAKDKKKKRKCFAGLRQWLNRLGQTKKSTSNHEDGERNDTPPTTSACLHPPSAAEKKRASDSQKQAGKAFVLYRNASTETSVSYRNAATETSVSYRNVGTEVSVSYRNIGTKTSTSHHNSATQTLASCREIGTQTTACPQDNAPHGSARCRTISTQTTACYQDAATITSFGCRDFATQTAGSCRDVGTETSVCYRDSATQWEEAVITWKDSVTKGPSRDKQSFRPEFSLDTRTVRNALKGSSASPSSSSSTSCSSSRCSLSCFEASHPPHAPSPPCTPTTSTLPTLPTSPVLPSPPKPPTVRTPSNGSETAEPRKKKLPISRKTCPSLPQNTANLPTAAPAQKKAEKKPVEQQPINNPEQILTESFTLMSSDDWEENIKGMGLARKLVEEHPDVLLARRREVCLAVILEVSNPRSSVSRAAVVTLGTMYAHLKKKMDQELESTASALLQKFGVSNDFIRQDVDTALASMVQNCTPIYVMKALLAGGLRHLNPVVRKCTAQHLADLVERVGAARLLSDSADMTERILPAVARLAQDSSQDARYFGRQILLSLASHPDFDRMLNKYVQAKDIPALKDITNKTQGPAKPRQNSACAKGGCALPGCGPSHSVTQVKQHSMTEKEQYLESLMAQMGSSDFRLRVEAINKVVTDCQQRPGLVVACKLPVFDAIAARLQESNRKINLFALEALQSIIPLLKDSLAQVVNILVPAIVENHLNSTNTVIRGAAVGVLDCLLHNLDNALLLEVFCSKARLLSGKAKGVLIEKLAGLVMDLYPKKPQSVEQKVLPLLWTVLGSSTNRHSTAALCRALYAQMGDRLRECAGSKSADVNRALNEMLRTA